MKTKTKNGQKRKETGTNNEPPAALPANDPERRQAIPQHSTGWTSVDWDNDAQLERVRGKQGRDYYHRLFAWEDLISDPGDPKTYKFLHHSVDEAGDPGDANTRAIIRAIAELNGTSRGEVPEDERREVWNHLARHLREAGVEPAPMRSDITQKDLRRTFKISELRVEAAEGERPKIRGHAAVFDSLSVPIMGFRETIKKGAFSKTIRESDVRALWNHDENYVLGRTKNGTLTLREDDKGLAVEIDPPDAQWARDFTKSIERGDVDQMSFGFNTVKDRWYEEDGEMRRELIEVRLFDVSPVTFPAYEATDVQVRNAAKDLGIDAKAFAAAIRSARAGKLGEADTAVLRSAHAAIQALLPTEPPENGHSDGDDEPPENGHSDVEMRRRRLDLIEAEIL